jgi:membrane-bound lytic murein transglycosylase C
MKPLLFTIAVLVAMVATSWEIRAQDPDPFDALERMFDETAGATEKTMDEQMRQTEEAWNAAAKAHEEAWNKMADAVEGMWGDKIMPSNKVWVSYDQGLDARSRVDFEKGKVTIDVLVESTAPDVVSAGKEKIAEKFEKMYEAKDPETKESILDNQLAKADGSRVRPEIVPEYVKEEVIPKVVVEPVPIKGTDGKRRYKVTATVDLIPEHLRVRVERYLESVLRESNRQSISPALVLAIMHSESSFNPRAHSPAGAFGLMQLIPRYGARDAHLFLKGKDRVIQGPELFEPDFNIELGVAYLHICFNRYLKNVEDMVNREYMVICGYNWGPPAVSKKIAQKHDVNKLSNEELYAALREGVPTETRNYLENVTKRKESYAALFKE